MGAKTSPADVVRVDVSLAIFLDNARERVMTELRRHREADVILISPEVYAELAKAKSGELERGLELWVLGRAVLVDPDLRGEHVEVGSGRASR